MKKYNALMEHPSLGTYKGVNLGDYFLELYASLVPQCGYSGLSTLTPFVAGLVFSNTGFSFNADPQVNALTLRDTIQQLVTKNTVDACIPI